MYCIITCNTTLYCHYCGITNCCILLTIDSKITISPTGPTSLPIIDHKEIGHSKACMLYHLVWLLGLKGLYIM